jgi:hypothetical protein
MSRRGTGEDTYIRLSSAPQRRSPNILAAQSEPYTSLPHINLRGGVAVSEPIADLGLRRNRLIRRVPRLPGGENFHRQTNP